MTGPVRQTPCNLLVRSHRIWAISLLSGWVDNVVFRRAVWVENMQLGLVATDPTIAAWQACMAALKGFLHILAAVVSYSTPSLWENLALLHLCVQFCLSILRCYGARCHPDTYAQWRWLVILLIRLDIAVTAGNAFHCSAIPTHSISGYLKTLLISSGIIASAQAVVLDWEMFHLSVPCSSVLLVALCHHSTGVCQGGLLATSYSTAMTRRTFYGVGKAANILGNLVRPFENDTLLAVPGEPDPQKDLPCCLCLVQTLAITLGVILPNTFLYLYESHFTRQENHHKSRRHRHSRPWLYQLAVILMLWVGSLLRGVGITLLGGTLAWAVLRYYHEV